LFKTTKKILLSYVLAPLLMIVFLYLIYRQIISKGDIATQWQELKQYFYVVPFYIWILVFSFAPLNWAIEAFKWRIALKGVIPIRFIAAFKAILTGIAFAMVTPGKVGDFAGRIMHLPRKYRLFGAVITLLTNVIQVVATCFMGCIGAIYFALSFANSTFSFIVLLGVVLVVLFYLIWKWRRYLWQLFIKIRIIQKYYRLFRRLERVDRKVISKIFLLSIVRFLTYNIQFLILVNALGNDIPWGTGLCASMFMFWMITMIPSLFLSDIGIRGFLASIIFINTGIATQSLALLSASYIIWLVNLILPSVVGSLLLLFIKKQNH
jgi:hypothetical protein